MQQKSLILNGYVRDVAHFMRFIETERLILRKWKTDDQLPYFQINQDLKVIEYLLSPLTMEQVGNFSDFW